MTFSATSDERIWIRNYQISDEANGQLEEVGERILWMEMEKILSLFLRPASCTGADQDLRRRFRWCRALLERALRQSQCAPTTAKIDEKEVTLYACL